MSQMNVEQQGFPGLLPFAHLSFMSLSIHSLEQRHHLQGPVQVENMGPLFKHEGFQDDKAERSGKRSRSSAWPITVRKRLRNSFCRYLG